MIAIKRILVPTDFSEGSMAALRYAIHFGNALDVETIDVMHVWQPPSLVKPDTKVQSSEGKEQTLAEFVHSEAGKQMKEVLAKLEQSGFFEVGGRLESGDPHKRILAIATAEDYDLIIMGTRGQADSDRLGSVAQRVVRDSNTPVLTIRRPTGLTDPPPAAD